MGCTQALSQTFSVDTVRVQVVERVGGERRRQGCRSDSKGQRSAAVAAAKRAGDGGSGRSHAIVGEARLAGSDQLFVTLMSELLTQRADYVLVLGRAVGGDRCMQRSKE